MPNKIAIRQLNVQVPTPTYLRLKRSALDTGLTLREYINTICFQSHAIGSLDQSSASKPGAGRDDATSSPPPAEPGRQSRQGEDGS